ncbi:Protein CDC73-like protein [Vigna angularis]|uniref:Protein CDC73-like protein n=1 Tax=Phaseolus angularis TaxID=3914 RepID=A0A8T0JKJ6_PHAAN|nr:Protein CDC73-like protein [Vigna angularis]
MKWCRVSRMVIICGYLLLADNGISFSRHFFFSNFFPLITPREYKQKRSRVLLAIPTVVIISEILKTKGFILKKEGRGIPKAKIIIWFALCMLIRYLHLPLLGGDSLSFHKGQPGTLTSTDSIEYRPEDPSFAPKSTLPSQTQAHPQPQEQPDKLDLISLITSAERPLKDRQSLLECKNRDFYSVLVSATKREEDRQRMESQQRKDGLVAKSRLMAADDRGLGFSDDMGGYDPTPKPKMLLKGTKIGEGVPIILVPSAFQTLITIYNVKEFLEDGVYIPTDVKVKQMKGARPDCVTVQKKLSRDRVVTAYEVRDKPSSLKPDDWDRVVAVFVLGKEWQFKDWPFKDHVEIFNKIIGFYMRFEDDSLESAKNVKQWNVKIISISKNKRHQDRAAALDVWERLEEFVRARSRS